MSLRSAAVLLGLAADLDTYRRQGFLVKRAMLDPEEMGLIQAALESDRVLNTLALRNDDANGGFSKVILLGSLDNGTLGTSMRLARCVRLLRALLGEPTDLMHWMTRIIHKLPHRGGEWNWHQDYGYWQQDGFRRCDMVTMYLAVDNQTLDNGPLRLLKGSHQMGVAPHATRGGGGALQGAACERFNEAKSRFPEVTPMLQSGDILFLHPLLYHTSSGNTSPVHRRALTAVFTRADNVDDAGMCCRPVEQVEDTALLQQGVAVGVNAFSFVKPHGYVGDEAHQRHGYVAWDWPARDGMGSPNEGMCPIE
jgi:hypothetical protein